MCEVYLRPIGFRWRGFKPRQRRELRLSCHVSAIDFALSL